MSGEVTQWNVFVYLRQVHDSLADRGTAYFKKGMVNPSMGGWSGGIPFPTGTILQHPMCWRSWRHTMASVGMA